MLLGPDEKFGIVSTGKVWEELLGTAVRELLGGESESPRFGGVRTTGLSAKELHDLPADVVREQMVDATRRLLRGGDVRVVCLGCAGMVGMNDIVREAAILELGQKGHKVHIVDGVLAGASILRSFVRSS
jgi:Asp/Glu/hydantoin racemase